MYKCPKCHKPLKNELDMGVDKVAGYAVDSALRMVVASGRSPYWACTNPECGCCFREDNKFWFKINSLNMPVPKSFIAGTLGIWPKSPKKRRR